MHVAETGLFAYPDALVLCGKPDLLPNLRQDTLTNPCAIFEILSESTERWDRGAKASHYRRMSSLREYTLISQDEARIKHYVRQSDGLWSLRDYLVGWSSASIRLSCIEVDIPLSEIYRSVEGIDPEMQGA
jgi:Uma2 family endonuclease